MHRLPGDEGDALSPSLQVYRPHSQPAEMFGYSHQLTGFTTLLILHAARPAVGTLTQV
jgi:hypothetical protein